jgi:hypothetical protein
MHSGTKILVIPTGSRLHAASYVALVGGTVVSGDKVILIPTGSSLSSASYTTFKGSPIEKGDKVILIPTGSFLTSASWIAIKSYVTPPPTSTCRIADGCFTNLTGKWTSTTTYGAPYDGNDFNQATGAGTCTTHVHLWSRHSGAVSNHIDQNLSPTCYKTLNSMSFFYKWTSDCAAGRSYATVGLMTGASHIDDDDKTSTWRKYKYTWSPPVSVSGTFQISIVKSNLPGHLEGCSLYVSELKFA